MTLPVVGECLCKAARLPPSPLKQKELQIQGSMVFKIGCWLFCDLEEEGVVSWGLTVSYSLDQFGVLNESEKAGGKVLWNDA